MKKATIWKHNAIPIRRLQLEHHYSEKNSETFWAMVNSLDEPHKSELYALGVALQPLESQTLKAMHDCAPGFVAEKYWYNKP